MTFEPRYEYQVALPWQSAFQAEGGAEILMQEGESVNAQVSQQSNEI